MSISTLDVGCKIIAPIAPQLLALPPEEAAAIVNELEVEYHFQLYMELGFAVVPLDPGTKRPYQTAWSLRGHAPHEFRVGDGIGLMTGKLSGDLVAVDLDSPEAIQLASRFLPPTNLVEGRDSKPSSHWFFKVTDIPTEETSTAAGGIGGPKIRHYAVAKVDVLGTGGQIAIPPSNHPSGERRRWEKFGQPAVLPHGALMAAVRRLTAACGQPAEPIRSATPLRTRPPAPSSEHYELPGLPPLNVRIERASAYTAKILGAVSGEGGHDATFRVACNLVRDFALPMDEARALLVNFNLRCTPPWSDEELAHKLSDANEFLWLRGRLLLPPRPGTPHDVARHVLASDGFRHLRYWRGEWWSWDGRAYALIARTDMRARVTRIIHHVLSRPVRGGDSRPTRPVVNRAWVDNTLQALTGYSCVDANIELPSWLDGRSANDLIVVQNGILDVPAVLRGEPPLKPHTPSLFTRIALPYSYDPTARCPQWLRALHRSLPEPGQIGLLQEWFGYNLVPDTSQQRFMVLQGEGGNGKSLVCAAMVALLGAANVSHLPFERIGDRFALASTIGKLANIASEVGEIDKAAEGVLKSFTSGDRMTADRKNRDPIEFQPSARLTLATNTLPRIRDRSSGVWRRMLLVPFPTVIPEGERVLGMDRPEFWVESGELSGILNWALVGLKRLRAHGRFEVPATSVRALDEYRSESNPARMFLESFCSAGPPTERVVKSNLYAKYHEWCATNGFSYPLAAPQFGREVRRVFPGVVDGKTGPGIVPRADCYVGVSYCPSGVEQVATAS